MADWEIPSEGRRALERIVQMRRVQEIGYRVFKRLYKSWLGRIAWFVGVGLFLSIPNQKATALLVSLLGTDSAKVVGILVHALYYLVGVLLIGTPWLLVGYHERKVAAISHRLSRILDALVQSIHRLLPTAHIRQYADPELAIDAIIEAIRAERKAEGEVRILTPDAIYLRAQVWLPKIEKALQGYLSPQLRHCLQVLARKGKPLEQELEDFRGSLFFILPDARDPSVQYHLRERMGPKRLNLVEHGAPENLLIEVNEEAQRWIARDLRRQRHAPKPKRPTSVHLTNVSPSHRLFLASKTGILFIQEMPDQRPGILEPHYVLERQLNPVEFALVEICLTTMTDAL